MRGTFQERATAVHQFIEGYFEQHKAAPKYADICTALHMSPMELSHILKVLEARGLIERTGTTRRIVYRERAG
jgi:DNA-binding MarR family transcriptional regulator